MSSKRAQLDRNPRFDSHGLTVTINLAKPEFKNIVQHLTVLLVISQMLVLWQQVVAVVVIHVL